MQFGRLFLAAAASTAIQALELTDTTYAGITVGETFDITWKDATGDVTLILLDDTNPLNAVAVETIASGLTGTSFAWDPSATLINAADYAIKIVDSVTSNYGAQFQLVGGATTTPSATAASTSAPATTTSQSSASSIASSIATTESNTSSVPPTTSAPTTSASSTSFTNSTTTKAQSSASSKAVSTTTGPSGSQTSAPSSANSIATPLVVILLTVAALISLN